MDDELKQRVDTLAHDVDVIQNKLLKTDAPAWKTVSFWISAIAFVVSVASTGWSTWRANVQETQAARSELRTLLQRLAALPKENVEVQRKYIKDPMAAQTIGGLINQENSILARQAAEIAAKLPKGLVSSTEYYAVAMALESAYELNSTRRLLNLAIETADESSDFSSQISAIRALAYLDFITGKPDDGRALYQQARGIFTRYPDFDQYTQVNTNFLTEINWASAEAIGRSPDRVRQHLETADGLLGPLPASPGLDSMRNQLAVARTQFEAMGVIPKPSVPAMSVPSTPPSSTAPPVED